MPDGTIGHAEVRIGDSAIMMAEQKARIQPMPAGILLYVEDCDATYSVCALQMGGHIHYGAQEPVIW